VQQVARSARQARAKTFGTGLDDLRLCSKVLSIAQQPDGAADNE